MKITLLITIIFFLRINVIISQQSATIDINMLQVGQDTISSNIYGGFIEFLGDVINGQIWAQELLHRGLDYPDINDPTIARGWIKYFSGLNTCIWSLDSNGYNENGVYAQKINITSFSNGFCGIAQSVNIINNQSYDFYLYIKGQNINGNVTVCLYDSSMQIIDSLQFSNIGTNWQKYSGTLTSAYTGQSMLSVSFEEAGTLWIDEISLIRTDAIDGVSKEYFDWINILNITIMRYPGGCFADDSANFWEYGIGDIDKRKSPNFDTFWGGFQRMDFGLDEYIKFCHNTGMEPQITVNFGTRDSIDARNLVEYANGDTNTYYGNLRAQNGYPYPHNIQYWEIGNEQYGNWETGHTDAINYANRFIGFASQMKTVDSTIKIIANGELASAWTDTVLTIAGNHMDYISIHEGIPYISYNDTLYTDEQIYKAMVARPLFFKKCTEIIENKISILGLNNVKIALTEWWQDYSCPKYLKHDHSQEVAVYVAGMLNVLQQKYDIVDIANRTTFCEILNSMYKPDSFYIPPSAYVLSLYSNFSGLFPVNYSVNCPIDSASAIGNFTVQDSVPLLDVSVTKNNNHTFINVVNRSLTDSITTNINLNGNTTSLLTIIRIINGDSYLAKNDSNHTNITIYSDTLFFITGQAFSHTFAPHSITGIELIDTSTIVNNANIFDNQMLSVFPNPFSDKCNIIAHSNSTISIFDLSGKIIIKFPEEKYSYIRKVTWSPDVRIKRGTYFVKVINNKNGNQYFKKIVYVK